MLKPSLTLFFSENSSAWLPIICCNACKIPHLYITYFTNKPSFSPYQNYFLAQNLILETYLKSLEFELITFQINLYCNLNSFLESNWYFIQISF